MEDSRLEGSEGTRKLVQILMRKSDTEGTVLEDGERNSQATEVRARRKRHVSELKEREKENLKDTNF